ncbi:MAG: hypothetical protein QMB33_02215, partial [Opitutales bacterium]
MQALKTALTRQGVVHFSHTCCKTGAWATRPRLHQHRPNIGPTWATRPSLHQPRHQRGRVAQVCTNLGINVGESPTLLSPDQSLHSRGHFVSAQPHMLFAELKHVF